MKIDDNIKNLVISQLKSTSIYEGVEFALTRIETVAGSIAEKKGEEKLTGFKIGTILTCAVIKKITEGKNPKEFTRDEWIEIANAVVDYAVIMDNQQYSEFVFLLYAEYIDFSVKCLPTGISDETKGKILLLSDEIRENTDLLRAGTLIETDYIDKCLWICLEAIIKLMSSYSELVMPSQYSDLAKAITAFSFEYGRLMVYRREQAVLGECLNSQFELDAFLNEQYQTYADEINKETEEFLDVVKDAFQPGIRDRLLSSVVLAKKSGVEESQILNSLDKIDEFFM